MNATEVITVAMSRLDGARAAAAMVSDGRLTPDIDDHPHALGNEWGDPEFTPRNAAQAAFLGDGCEELSRHHQMTGDNWVDDHLHAFWDGFITVARVCLWHGGYKQ